MSVALASLALAVSAVIGLGRQFTVSAVFEPGLWLFQRYPLKRNVGLLVVAALAAGAFAVGTGPAVWGLTIAAATFGLFAVLFNLDLLFPPLRHVRTEPASSAAADEELTVVVLDHAGDRRAYPLERMVMARHLVHDVVGGTPVALTYCALCRSGLAYRAELDGQRLLFRVVGVFRRNLIMEDDATHTLWQQATGRGIYGRHRGAILDMLPAYQLPWREAKTQPGMTLAVEPADARFAVLATPRGASLLHRATETVMTPGRTRLTHELPPRETVFGVQIGETARAYPLSRVRGLGRFTDSVGGVQLQLTFHEDTETLEVVREDGLTPPVVQRHWWLGWKEFHPSTTVYGA
jgi:hypothetical protein